MSPDNNAFLMVVRESMILGIPLDPTDTSNNAMVPVSGITQGRDIEFDDQEQFVYWVQSTGSIWRVKTTGTNRTQFAPAAMIGSPSGLAFDWMSRVMYYTNPTGKSIEGSDGSVPPKVSSADMDGGNPRNLYTRDLAGISTITADLATRKLYWAVVNAGQIQCGSMDGLMTRATVVVSDLSLPWGLTVHGSHLYYTDADYEVVERVDKDSGANMVVLRSGMAGLRAIKVHARN
ncbi:hypothetical protein CRUP_036430, partial [Coryphaenoides rupestris]